jgi:hypothetical protein
VDLERPILSATAGKRRTLTLDDVMAYSPESYWFGCRKIRDVVVFKNIFAFSFFY